MINEKNVKLVRVDHYGNFIDTHFFENDDKAWDFINDENKHDRFWIFD